MSFRILKSLQTAGLDQTQVSEFLSKLELVLKLPRETEEQKTALTTSYEELVQGLGSSGVSEELMTELQDAVKVDLIEGFVIKDDQHFGMILIHLMLEGFETQPLEQMMRNCEVEAGQDVPFPGAAVDFLVDGFKHPEKKSMIQAVFRYSLSLQGLDDTKQSELLNKTWALAEMLALMGDHDFTEEELQSSEDEEESKPSEPEESKPSEPEESKGSE